MTSYTLTSQANTVLKTEDGQTFVVRDGTGYEAYQVEWDAYQTWLSEGGVPNAYVPPIEAYILDSPDLATAKERGRTVEKDRSRELQTGVLDGYTAEQIAAQAAVPSGSRDVRMQNIITDLNDLTTEEITVLDAIDSAATIQEVHDILFP